MFFLNVPIVLAAAAVAFRTVRPDTCRGPGRLDRGGGVVLGALTLAAATFAVIETGHSGLGMPAVVAIVVTVIALGGFLRVAHTAADPMLPLALCRRPAFVTANSVAAVMNFGTLGLLFPLTLFLQTVQDRSALDAGLAVLPLFLPLTVLAPHAGPFTARIGPAPVMVAGLLLAAAGVGLLATWWRRPPTASCCPPCSGGESAWGCSPRRSLPPRLPPHRQSAPAWLPG